MTVESPEVPPAAPPVHEERDMVPQTIRYSPIMFLKVMLAIAWSAFAHPFSTTVIDVSTGRALPAENE